MNSPGQPGAGRARNLRPSAVVSAFLEMCSSKSLPLDFFSWHCHTDTVSELVTRARLHQTKRHLDDWNLFPDNS